ncbi:MAG: RNA-binding S4 domain-containing protein [Eubacteriales bacterium]|nr:RNA-binding S4 domain-containing protein [Eubacteriales bacterium]
MRLDKYLKVSRLIKRRTVAAEAASTGHVSLNGRPAKPASDVKVGDRITVRFGSSETEYEVLAVSEHMPKAGAAGMYRLISGTEEEEA